MKKVLKIEGMTCQHCVERVNKVICEVSGVKGVRVNIKKKEASVNVVESVTDEALRDALNNAGYEVVEIINKKG